MLNRLKSKKKGGFDVYIAMFISLVFMLAMFVYIVNMLGPINRYIAINNLVRKYTLKMEIDGGLTTTSLNNLKTELTSADITIANVTITTNPGVNTYAKFGENVSLEVQYNCPISQKSLDGLTITNTTTTVPLKVKKTTVSKNASH